MTRPTNFSTRLIYFCGETYFLSRTCLCVTLCYPLCNFVVQEPENISHYLNFQSYRSQTCLRTTQVGRVSRSWSTKLHNVSFQVGFWCFYSYLNVLVTYWWIWLYNCYLRLFPQICRICRDNESFIDPSTAREKGKTRFAQDDNPSPIS